MILPNFIVIGGIKCGTTSLYHYMIEHPQIFLCPKEIHYFLYGDRNPVMMRVTSLDKYTRLFDKVKNEVAIGEVAVRYMHKPIAVKNIKATIPDARIIALLRNPVERTFSHFLMHCRIGNIKTKNGKRVGSQPSRDQIDELLSNPNHYFVDCSRYYKHLIRYYDAFPKKKIFVAFLEDLNNDGVSTMKRIFQFLKVNENFVPDTRIRYNIATTQNYNRVLMAMRRSRFLMRLATCYFPEEILISFNRWRKRGKNGNIKRIEIPKEVRTRMKNWFYEDNLKLQDLLGRDISEWL